MSTIGTARPSNKAKTRWEIAYRIGKRRIFATIDAKSEREALREIANRVSAGVAVASNKITVADWLNQWLPTFTTKRGKPSAITVYNYRSVIDVWLIPELGDVKLKDLTPIAIKTAFLKMTKREKPPAASTLGQVRNVLAAALRNAVKFDMITVNPLDKLRGELPIGQSPAAQPAKRETVDFVLTDAEVGEPYPMALYLALALGMRRGELCGLRWRDIEDDKITVREQIVPVGKTAVTKAPKYDSAREIKIGPKVAERLRQHRRKLAEKLLANGVRLTVDHPVCAHDDGRPMRPGSFTGWCGRRGFRLHGVRHLNASTLLTTQPIAVVAGRLGHSRPDVTLRTYAHVLPGQDDAAATAIDAVI